MGYSTLLPQVIWVGVILSEMATSAVAATYELALPNCPDRCGDVDIPFPFGTTDGCYLNQNDDFFINCTQSAGRSQQPMTGDFVVQNISIQGQLDILMFTANICYSESGIPLDVDFWLSSLGSSSTFTISSTQNVFTAIGCDTYAFLNGDQNNGNFSMGCMTICTQNKSNVLDGTCSGIGCCQVDIPERVSNFSLEVHSFNNHTKVWSFNPCSYAFVVKKDKFSFSSAYLSSPQYNETLPIVIDWTIGDKRCENPVNKSDYICGGNSTCYSPANGYGYRCDCYEGYEGNPYLPTGCKDINECLDPNLNNCTSPKRCINTEGNYTCSCPKWHSGDGRKGGEGCALNLGPVYKIAIVGGVGFIVLLVSSSWMYLIIKQRKLIKLRESFFRKNGGVILSQQLISKRENSVETAKIFSTEELEKATNNYDENLIIGQGGFGTVYKGFLSDSRVVAIKKSKIVDQSQIEQFINEVLVLSQINHRNVVKLLGCCLETEVPLLVYEFVPNGTLFEHIHYKISRPSAISWDTRLKIAAETAGALSYLHSAASPPIIHRDVKSSNILLDGNYTAKVSDFGASRLIPLDQINVATMVQGTLGYLDPEYLHTSQLTEKSDVYSFGVVLIELLTGEKALSFVRPEEFRSLAVYFLSAFKEDRLIEVLEKNLDLGNVGNEKQLKEVANLARRCVNVKGEDRPTMKEVVTELEGLRRTEKHSWVNVDAMLEETEYLLGETSDSYKYDAMIKNTVVYDSIKDHTIEAFDDGR